MKKIAWMLGSIGLGVFIGGVYAIHDDSPSGFTSVCLVLGVALVGAGVCMIKCTGEKIFE